MRIIKRFASCMMSLLLVATLGTTASTAKNDLTTEESTANRIITPEYVEGLFKDAEFKRRVSGFMEGIVNSHRPDSQMTDIPLDHIFIGKKPFEYAHLKENGEFDYGDGLYYLVFGIDDRTNETTVFGNFMVSRYPNTDNYTYGFSKGEPSTSSILCKSGPFAVFGYDEFHKEQPTYWQTYAVNATGSVYTFNSGIKEGTKVPKADYTALADKDGRNIINAECFVPAYTLKAEAVSDVKEYSSKVTNFSDGVTANHTYLIRNVHSGLYLQANDNKIPSSVYQYNSDLAPNPAGQKFKLVQIENTGKAAFYNLVPAVNEKARLDVDNALDDIGTKLKLYKPNKAYPQAQLFQFIPNKDGTYRIQPKLSQTRVLDLKNVSTKDNAEIVLWDFVNANSQKWILIDLDNAPEKPVGFFCEPSSYPKGTKSISLHKKNSTDDKLNFDGSYSVQKYDGAEWKEVYSYADPYENAYYLIPNTESTEKIKICEDENSLESGKYRIAKSFYGSEEKYYAELEVQ